MQNTYSSAQIMIFNSTVSILMRGFMGAAGGYCDAGTQKWQLLRLCKFGVKLAVIADLPCIRFRENCSITTKIGGCDG